MKSVFILSTILVLTVVGLGVASADAQKTSGYNFCKAFPAFPECVGWRTEAITDNYWFCEYVKIDNLCKNEPEPEKKIQPRGESYCCRLIGDEKIKQEEKTIQEEASPIHTTKSIQPLIIWTDKDHYNYRDKVTVYGKFDYSNPTIKENVRKIEFDQTSKKTEKYTVDIKLNGRVILRDIPVSNNGWFSAFFYHNNSYIFSTQNNLLEVEYIVSAKDVPLGGPKTHAVYQFTTGNVAKEDKEFKLKIDSSTLPDKLRYEITVEKPENFIDLARNDFIKTRMTTPEGYTIPIHSTFSIRELSSELDAFKEYGYGNYTIQVTYGNNVAEKEFEYTG